MKYAAYAHTLDGKFQMDSIRDGLYEELEKSNLKAMEGFSASFVTLEVKLDSIFRLLEIPDWAIDAELVAMNWRSK